MTEAVEAMVEKAKENFDLAAVLGGVSYPTTEVKVFIDANAAFEYEENLARISELGADSANAAAGNNGGIADLPEKEEIDAEIAELESRQRVLLEKLVNSAMTFHLRGLAPAAARLIAKSWNRKIKPETQGADDIADAEDARAKKINAELISKTVVKIVNASGAASSTLLDIPAAENLYDVLLDSEYYKLLGAVNDVCFASSIFENVAAADADFLSQP